MVQCPDEHTLLRYAAGELIAAEVDRLDAHIDGCPACADLVAYAVRDAGDGHSEIRVSEVDADASVRDDAPVLASFEAMPDAIDRYVLLQRIGTGGMGTVWSAWDPQLARKVAIKVLRPGCIDRGRFLRQEARALALLTHPNVVQVFAVGSWAERGMPPSVYLVMELVEGDGFRRWCQQPGRSEAEILAAFHQAGRGLAAAHAAGLVHRDFKPDNVLIERDAAGIGRVRVTDFGLARPSTRDAISADADATLTTGVVPDEASWTQAGVVMGTPGYMAPEQRDGLHVDARADQYAFCVSLWEALCGARPGAMHDAELDDPRRLPPPRIRHALARGLAEDPARRFVDMNALLRALYEPPRRRALTIAAIALAVPLAWVAVAGMDGNAAQRPPLDHGAVAVAALFGPDAELSGDSREQVQRLRAELARAEALDAIDRPQLALAVIEPIVDEAARLDHPPLLASAALLHGTVLRHVGDYPAAGESLTRAHVLASAHGLADVAAASAIQQVFVVGSIGEDYEGGATWVRHAETAIARLPVEARAQAEGDLATTRGHWLETAGQLELAQLQYEAALDHIDRSLPHDHPDRVFAINDLGTVMLDRDPELALAHLGEALALARTLHGDHDPRVSLVLGNIGALHEHRGDTELAAEYAAAVLAIEEGAGGPEHPDVARAAYNLGVLQDALGDDVAAEGSFRRAQAIWTAAHGPDHTLVGRCFDNLGALAYEAGDLEGGEREYHRALALYERTLGAEHAALVTPLSGLAEIAMLRGQTGRGLALAERALALGGSSSLESRAGMTFRVARALWQDGQRDAAIARAELALAQTRTDDDPMEDGSQYAPEIAGWIAASDAR